jgi:hypothetical protein
VQVARERPQGEGDVLLVSYDLTVSGADPVAAGKRVAAFLAERHWNVPAVVLDPAEVDAWSDKFALPGPIPVTLAFDRFGHLADREDGPASKARFEELFAHAK